MFKEESLLWRDTYFSTLRMTKDFVFNKVNTCIFSTLQKKPVGKVQLEHEGSFLTVVHLYTKYD